MAKRTFSDSDSSNYSELSSDDESGDEQNSENEQSKDINISGDGDSSDESCVSEGECQEAENDVVQEEDGNSDVEIDKTQTLVKNELNPMKTSGRVAAIDEYEYDSSDEEDLRNTIGNVPVEWYRDYTHIGYDLEGNKIIKPPKKDELDEFLTKVDDPYYWRTVKDRLTGQNVVLTDDDVNVVQRLTKARFPDSSFDPYSPFIDFFTYEKMIHPVTNRPETKASFIPSIGEKRAISRLVFRIKRAKNLKLPRVSKPKDDRFDFTFDLWSSEDQPNKRLLRYIPAPKVKLPGHEESYNPPLEYLMTEEEKEQWKNKEPEERKLNFIPQKFEKLRHVPTYANFVKERFDRCLDLYLCPRVRKMRANVNPEDLIPILPKPRELQPFPTMSSLVYIGHEGPVRCVSVEPKGQFLISGSNDNTIKFWEILSGRCLKTIKFDAPVSCVSWCPDSSRNLCIVSVDKTLFILNPSVGDRKLTNDTDSLFKELFSDNSSTAKVSGDNIVDWETVSENDDIGLWKKGIRVVIKHRFEINQVTWHFRGDYFAVVMSSAGRQAVVIHQLSKRRSQVPFQKSKGLIQRVLFHPSKSFLFVATQRYIRVYNLLKQELCKKLMCNCKYVSSLAIHPGGDNLIVGSYDLRLSWFDLDLSNKPYKTLRYHKKAIRQVVFHSKYPLFASASDDGTVVVTHAMVYNDLTQNALIVPVKVLRGHKTTADTTGAVSDCCFHPLQPWVFSCGSDATIRLYT